MLVAVMRIFTLIIVLLVLLFVFLQMTGIELTSPSEHQILEEETVVIETYDSKGNIVESEVVEDDNQQS